MSQKKLVILDTNVLIEDPTAFNAFDKEHIGLPIMVIEELDRIKSEASFRGRNAREAIRFLDMLREKGSLREGVQLDNESTLTILFPPEKPLLQAVTPSQDIDNQILALAQHMKQEGFEIDLITKDLNLRVKADALGIAAHDYKANLTDEQTIYRGWITIEASAYQLKKELPDELLEFP